MSLYHEAVEILKSASQNGGSIKSIVFGKKEWKSDRKTLFALTTETAKWSSVLCEVIDRSALLKMERQLRPDLALLLTHDLLLARKGLALPQKHGLAVVISKHKARLSAELSKARIRRGFASLDALKSHVNSHGDNASQVGAAPKYRHPRWIRVNTARTTLNEQLTSTFASYERTDSLGDITYVDPSSRLLYIDKNIPNLIAIPSSIDITSTPAYKQGNFVIQEKASCFPAYLLNIDSISGDIIDACAAPGNKTTHLAAILSTSPHHLTQSASQKRKIFACERDPERSKTLAKMIKLAGVEETVQIKVRQDFLKLDPESMEFAHVTAILLDPSCSGSGIVGRDEATITLHLPSAIDQAESGKNSKKRKRQEPDVPSTHKAVPVTASQTLAPAGEGEEEESAEVTSDETKLALRLSSLSSFQLRLLQHAMAFPAAKRITYSTCSLHDEENEHVVIKALLSDIARNSGWRVLRRGEQVEGLRVWQGRGKVGAVAHGMVTCEKDGAGGGGTETGKSGGGEGIDVDDIAEACIRCEKGGDEGTMGFFVAGFVREEVRHVGHGDLPFNSRQSEIDEEEWEGFGDEH